MINIGIDITVTVSSMEITYGSNVFGPIVEKRKLDDIRASLMDPYSQGPDVVYAIAMDVGKKEHKKLLEKMHLLFGVVTYSKGRLGNEPIRSQGHIHKVSSYSGWSTPEVYEIWSGKAIIYMQEFADDIPGRCYAIYAEPGDVVIVPPYWVHATISADANETLTFGAWCDRDYGFEYEKVRQHKGIAWFPVYNVQNEIEWVPNSLYQKSKLICKRPANYLSLGIVRGEPIYKTFERCPETFLYVPTPKLKQEVWEHFEP